LISIDRKRRGAKKGQKTKRKKNYKRSRHAPPPSPCQSNVDEKRGGKKGKREKGQKERKSIPELTSERTRTRERELGQRASV